MIHLLPETSGNLLAIRATEWLTTEDYKTLLPRMEAAAGSHKLRWYFEMDENFHGWTPGGAWEDLKFDIRHARDMERIAMVGDKKWENWLTKLMKPFTSAEVRFFELSERQQAMDWVREGYLPQQ